MDLKKTVNVKNRGIGEVGYTLQDSGVRRNWTPGEVKKNLTVGELEEATYVPGGLKLIQKYLVINDPEVCEYLGIETEPEYFYGEEEIKTLLSSGTVEQLLDCLDFAPGGVIDMIKRIAVTTNLNDYQKRQIIKEKIGFDVTAAIENEAYSKEPKTETKAKTRRAKPVTEKSEDKPTTATRKRRASAVEAK